MTTKRRTAAALALALAGAACAHEAPKPEVSVMSVEQWHGMRGGPNEPGALAATDAASWRGIWNRLGQPAPDFDASKFVGAAVFVGERPTGGWRAEIAATQDGDDLIARWKIIKPGGFTTQIITAPWLVRVFPRPKGRFILEKAPE